AQDAAGNAWLSTRPITVVLRHGGGWAAKQRSLVEGAAGAVNQFFAEPDGVVALRAEGGLFRFAGPVPGEPPTLPAPHPARSAARGGSVLFGGAPDRSPQGLPRPALPPDLRRLRIELAPLAFRAGLRYQTRLEPIDSGWGSPSAEPFAELTRLPPGSYTLH